LLLAAAALAAAAVMALLVPRPAGASSALHGRWRWPVRGAVVGRFAYTRGHAFAAGARRGLDIAAAPGSRVRSACSGRVTFAGAVPGGRGLGVTVRCGALAATHLGLGRVGVRRGARVAAGAPLGVLGPAGRLRLGARRAADRFAYVDPLRLLRADDPPDAPPAPGPGRRVAPRVSAPSPRVPGVVPLGRAPHADRLARVRAPRAAGSSVAVAPRPRAAAGARHDSAIPAGAWAGLVVLAAGVPLGGLVQRRRRRARRAATSVQATAAGR
jgi:Peptidase family M23